MIDQACSTPSLVDVLGVARDHGAVGHGALGTLPEPGQWDWHGYASAADGGRR